MAYWPENARSEFVTPAKLGGAGVCDKACRFQIASPAFVVPARRPTRGSGIGSPTDMLEIAGMLLERAEDDVVAHPVIVSAAATSPTENDDASQGCELK